MRGHEAGWTRPGVSARREVLRMAASVIQSHVQARGHAWTWSRVDWDLLIYSFIYSFPGLGQGLEAVGSRADGHPAHWSLESTGEKVESESESCLVVSHSATPWTVHGIRQARILEWVPIPFSRGPSQPRDQTQVSRITGGFFTS